MLLCHGVFYNSSVGGRMKFKFVAHIFVALVTQSDSTILRSRALKSTNSRSAVSTLSVKICFIFTVSGCHN